MLTPNQRANVEASLLQLPAPASMAAASSGYPVARGRLQAPGVFEDLQAAKVLQKASPESQSRLRDLLGKGANLAEGSRIIAERIRNRRNHGPIKPDHRPETEAGRFTESNGQYPGYW
jgi:hypothetical protein